MTNQPDILSLRRDLSWRLLMIVRIKPRDALVQATATDQATNGTVANSLKTQHTDAPFIHLVLPVL